MVEYQDGCFKKTKLAKFPEKVTFLTPWYTHVVGVPRGKKCLVFGKLGLLYFLKTTVLRFALLPSEIITQTIDSYKFSCQNEYSILEIMGCCQSFCGGNKYSSWKDGCLQWEWWKIECLKYLFEKKAVFYK